MNEYEITPDSIRQKYFTKTRRTCIVGTCTTFVGLALFILGNTFHIRYEPFEKTPEAIAHCEKTNRTNQNIQIATQGCGVALIPLGIGVPYLLQKRNQKRTQEEIRNLF